MGRGLARTEPIAISACCVHCGGGGVGGRCCESYAAAVACRQITADSMLRVRTRRELYSLLVRYSLRRGIWYRIAPAGREVHAVPVPFLCVYLTAGGTFVLRPPWPFRPSSSSRRSRRRRRRRTRTNRYGSRGVGYTCLYPPAPMGPARRCLTLSRPSRSTRSGTPSVINCRRSSLTV